MAQYEALVDVCQALMVYFPAITTERIVGHSDIAPGRKTDPGTGFDWGSFKNKLQETKKITMTVYSGHLRKMQIQYKSSSSPVEYFLTLMDENGEMNHEAIALNPLLGHRLGIQYKQEIHCVACSRKTSKSFNQGYCYPCFTRLASCDSCIMSPDKCHYEQGTCRGAAVGTG